MRYLPDETIKRRVTAASNQRQRLALSSAAHCCVDVSGVEVTLLGTTDAKTTVRHAVSVPQSLSPEVTAQQGRSDRKLRNNFTMKTVIIVLFT